MRKQMFDASWQELNSTDVTADQSAIDGLTANLKFTDFTANRAGLMADLPSVPVTVQVGFYAEAAEDNTSSFGCELWGSGPGNILQIICDLTGAAGPAIADMTNADNTSRLFYDDVTVSSSYWGDVTSGSVGASAMAYVEFTSRGITKLVPRFYNVGDATEADRIKALYRIR